MYMLDPILSYGVVTKALNEQFSVQSCLLGYIPEDNSEHHTRRRENLKSHRAVFCLSRPIKIVILQLAAFLSFCFLLATNNLC
jgi:hypothetical protein